MTTTRAVRSNSAFRPQFLVHSTVSNMSDAKDYIPGKPVSEGKKEQLIC